MLSVPGAKTVRGYSFFGDSFVYVLFEDGTDLYWARSRVLEYLNQVQAPAAGASAAHRSRRDGRRLDLRVRARRSHRARTISAQLRALQDWFLKYELKSVPDVAEVASVGGMVRQYQVVLDPDRLRAYRHPARARRRGDPQRQPGDRRLGASSSAKRSTWFARAATCTSWRTSAASRCAPATAASSFASATSRASRSVPRCAAASRSSTAKARSPAASSSCAAGSNALETIEAVKAKLEQLKPSLPPGVEIVDDLRPLAADRARGAQPARASWSRNSSSSRSCAALFLFHLRSAFVAVVALPLGVLDRVHRHALPGRQREHHVARRHRDRHRRDGRCGGRDDRERAQAPRAFRHAASRARRSNDGEALVDHRGRRCRGRPGAVLLAARSSRCRSSRCSRSRRRKAACSRRSPTPRPTRWPPRPDLSVTLVPVLMGYLIRGRIPDETTQSAQPGADRGLPARAAIACCASRAITVVAGARRAGEHGDPARAARRRVHAAAGRRRPAVHAVRAARDLGGQGRASSCSRRTG